MRKRIIALAVLMLLVAGTAVFGQFRGNRGGFGGLFDNPVQNDPPATELIMVRWHYTPGSRGDGWAHDYPAAEQHILQVTTETSLIDTDRMSYKVLELASPEIFDYPFAYVSEPGEMWLNEQEVENLREYIDRGGFVMVDDFGGQNNEAREYETFHANLRRVFPDREMFELTEDHPIFHNFYDIQSINAIHPMTGVKSVFLGFPDERGGLAMIICFRNDVGDFWEYIDNPRYPVLPSAEALKLGLNFLHYAMTH
jgi:hypothetical protein